MRLKRGKQAFFALLSGGWFFQGCPANPEVVEASAAASIELFLTDILTDALETVVDGAFGA